MYKNPDDLPLALDVEQVAQVLRVSRNTVYALIRSNKLRSIRVGRQIRITKEALLEYLAA